MRIQYVHDEALIHIYALTHMHRSTSESDILMRSETDCWFIGRKSDQVLHRTLLISVVYMSHIHPQREFFVVINQKGMSLAEVQGMYGCMYVCIVKYCHDR